MSQTIAEQVAEMGKAAEGQQQPPAMRVFAEEQAELRANGLPEGIAPVGSAMPDAELVDALGAATSLSKALSGAPAVVVLYRGMWCPFCNVALGTYQRRLLPELEERGVKLVAISPQSPDNSLTMQQKNELAFTVLSDEGNKVAVQLGVAIDPAAKVVAAQRELGLDLTAINADRTTALPMPTTVVVDADGVIRWIDVHPDYTTRSEVADIVAAVDAMLAAR